MRSETCCDTNESNVWTTAWSHTLLAASGDPFSASQTTMHTAGAAVLDLGQHPSQNFAPSPPSAHNPRMSRPPAQVTPTVRLAGTQDHAGCTRRVPSGWVGCVHNHPALQCMAEELLRAAVSATALQDRTPWSKPPSQKRSEALPHDVLGL
jgi:hypothetical protein